MCPRQASRLKLNGRFKTLRSGSAQVPGKVSELNYYCMVIGRIDAENSCNDKTIGDSGTVIVGVRMTHNPTIKRM